MARIGEVWCPPSDVENCKVLSEAEVRVGGVLSDTFRVRSGLRQGCTLAPTLFIIYFGAVVATWRDDCGDVGIDVLSRPGRRLVGDRTAKSRLNVVRIAESQFVDDLALFASTRDKLENVTVRFVKEAGRWGLTVSVTKTKGMASGEDLADSDTAPVQVEDDEIEMVERFTYLGSVVSSDCDILEDVKCRIARASRVFGCLRCPIFDNSTLSIATKQAVYQATVLAVLLYGAETWTLKAAHVRRLTTFHNHCVRIILGVTRYEQWQQRLTSASLLNKLGMQSIYDIIMSRRLRWLSHVGRMSDERLPKIVLFGELKNKRPAHGPKKRWRDLVSGYLQQLGMVNGWYQLCQDRGE